jgi:hypothetical protein
MHKLVYTPITPTQIRAEILYTYINYDFNKYRRIDFNYAYKFIHRYSTDNYVTKYHTTAAVPFVSTSLMQHDHQITVLDRKMYWMRKLMDNFLASHAPLEVPCRSLSPATSKVNFKYLTNMYVLYFKIHSLLFCTVYWASCSIITDIFY